MVIKVVEMAVLQCVCKSPSPFFNIEQSNKIYIFLFAVKALDTTRTKYF